MLKLEEKKTVSYGRNTLSTLVEGAELRIGSREVEVGTPISEESFQVLIVFIKKNYLFFKVFFPSCSSSLVQFF